MTGPSTLVVCDGQSLFLTPTGNDASNYLHRAMTPRARAHNVAVTGTTYAQREATTATRYGMPLSLGSNPVAVDLAGQADLWADMSATTLYAAAVSYWTARKAAGIAKVAICTVPDSSNFVASPTQNAQRLAYNQLLRSSTFFDGVVDLAADARFATVSGTYLGDGTHPTAAGALAIAELMQPVVDRLVA